MKIAYLYAFCWFVLLFILGCVPEEGRKQYVIGVSQCAMNNAWRRSMIQDMRVEALNHPELVLKVADADRNSTLQIEQIERFIRERVDLLIISANESEPLTPVAIKAYQSGIPTIILERKIESDQYTAFIGADNFVIGRQAGVYVRSLLSQNPDAEVWEIWGVRGASASLERHGGFLDALDDEVLPNIREIDGQWEPDSVAVAIAAIPDLSKVRVVYAHSDMMALAAREAIAQRDSTLLSRIHFIGIDGQLGKGLGVEAVVEGKLDASFYYPSGGGTAMKVAWQILSGQAHSKNYALNSAMIDKDNAGTLYLQLDRLEEYQHQVSVQKEQVDDLLHRYKFLRNSLLIILFLIVMLIISFGYLVSVFRKSRKINSLLRERNRLVRQQREELAEAKRQIEEVTAQRLKFFTNVTHEVKTPLTLILGPINKMEQDAPEGAFADDIRIIKKNAQRLRRVIEQLLDFRKIEFNKMGLRVSRTEFVGFTAEIKSCFDSLAESRNITYQFEHEMRALTLWVDTDKMEKVLTNLLSNAFKFTPEGGSICIRLCERDEEVVLSVEDNGEGIPPENLRVVFERFFTSGHGYTTGTGIGLHLVREFVQMHKGRVEVESIPRKRTCFTVHLPKGQAHFDASCVFLNETLDSASGFVDPEPEVIQEKLNRTYDQTVLVVEDDSEIRPYLTKELSTNFRVLAAENGRKALELLRSESVGLILTDVMMPEMNGYELCQQVKSDIAFSHIPVILLTALGEDSQRMYGLAKGADAYIAKPFNIDVVKLRIINLLEERKRLREALHKASENLEPMGGKAMEETKNMDDLFMRKFIQLIEENFADPNFNIEKGSEKLGLSRVHLYRKVKELSGITPIEFLRNYRLKRATALLRQRSGTISEVAYSTGFGSPAYFSKCFKTVYQITPTEFVDSLS